MSNALRLVLCLPFGRQWKFDQSPLFSVPRLLSLFAAASMLLGSLLGFSAVAVAEEEMIVEDPLKHLLCPPSW